MGELAQPEYGRMERTLAIITVPSNRLVAQIHNRMPAILEPGSYDRWLSTAPDPRDLLMTYPSEPMRMWPISTRGGGMRGLGRLLWTITSEACG